MRRRRTNTSRTRVASRVANVVHACALPRSRTAPPGWSDASGPDRVVASGSPTHGVSSRAPTVALHRQVPAGSHSMSAKPGRALSAPDRIAPDTRQRLYPRLGTGHAVVACRGQHRRGRSTQPRRPPIGAVDSRRSGCSDPADHGTHRHPPRPFEVELRGLLSRPETLNATRWVRSRPDCFLEIGGRPRLCCRR